MLIICENGGDLGLRYLIARRVWLCPLVHALPFYRRKWKRSTVLTNEDRIAYHLTSQFGPRALSTLGRKELQSFLDSKGEASLSFSVVDHLRWDLKQMFDLALAEGFLLRNPAQVLFTPRGCPRPEATFMTIGQVQTLFGVLAVRERLIAALAVIAGMRPGEIFGLRWARLESEHADIRERVYRGDIDSPKTVRSVRFAALSDGLVKAIGEWRAVSAVTSPEAWVFPSEKLITPLSRDNCWRRHFKPKLAKAGLGWVNFQVMRRMQLAFEGARRRPAGAGRADGPHGRRQRKRLHADFAPAPAGSSQRPRECPRGLNGL